MRAIQVTEFGGPEVLELAEVARPEPGPTEVLVRMAAAGVNPVQMKEPMEKAVEDGSPEFWRFIQEQDPVVGEADLPRSHPGRPAADQRHGRARVVRGAEPSVTVVGSRRPSGYGREVATAQRDRPGALDDRGHRRAQRADPSTAVGPTGTPDQLTPVKTGPPGPRARAGSVGRNRRG